MLLQLVMIPALWKGHPSVFHTGDRSIAQLGDGVSYNVMDAYDMKFLGPYSPIRSHLQYTWLEVNPSAS